MSKGQDILNMMAKDAYEAGVKMRKVFLESYRSGKDIKTVLKEMGYTEKNKRG